MDLLNRIKQQAAALLPELIDIRRHLHRHPELSMHEARTSNFIQLRLIEMGVPFETGMAKHGVVGLIKGKNPGSRTIALRADMDALPITEQNETAYCSENPGVMHACGHDVHMTSLLGASAILNELKDEFEGTIKLIFQPSEEKFPGGASMMIAEGVLENPRPEKMF
ncbi:MAG TPA: amidohydrolase, partial [Bacteroidales bacterium]|nr:amidohydrolase [Bacteroidales bacterium]